MIIDENVIVNITKKNIEYYCKFGYDKGKQKIPLIHLAKFSRILITCKCDICSSIFKRRYEIISKKPEQLCISCRRKEVYKVMDKTKLNKYRKTLNGSNNPNWSPDTKEYTRYKKLVYKLTEQNYTNYKHLINPKNYSRTLCGVENGYQLDHIISIKTGFLNKIDAKMIADINNLQMLSWKDNNKKR